MPGRAGHAAQAEDRDPLDVRPQPQPCPEPGVDGRRGDAGHRGHQDQVDVRPGSGRLGPARLRTARSPELERDLDEGVVGVAEPVQALVVLDRQGQVAGSRPSRSGAAGRAPRVAPGPGRPGRRRRRSDRPARTGGARGPARRTGCGSLRDPDMAPRQAARSLSASHGRGTPRGRVAVQAGPPVAHRSGSPRPPLPASPPSARPPAPRP